MARKPKRRGRPSQYRAEFVEQAYKQCLAGATDADLARFFDVSEQTLNTWKRKQPEFLESLRRGKEVAHGEVANAIYRAAVGYERTVEKVVDGAVVACKEWVPGDVGAMKYFMNNRRHRDWRNDPEVSVEVNNSTLNLPADIINKANEARKARQLYEAETPQIEAS